MYFLTERLDNNHNKHVDIVKTPLSTPVSERGSAFVVVLAVNRASGQC